MIDEIDILHERHSHDFISHAGKESAGLLCIVSYHQEIVVELGEYCFNTLSEFIICPGAWTSVLLIQPIQNFKSYI